jgi:hypothetical protein
MRDAIRFRKLRIAWSVAWGIAAVLLIVLWVRSHRSCDYIAGSASTHQVTWAKSLNGKLFIGCYPTEYATSWLKHGRIVNGADIEFTRLGFYIGREEGLGQLVALPIWFLSITATGMATAP